MKRDWVGEEQGQAVVEYVLLLSVAVGFVGVFLTQLLRPLFGKLQAFLSRQWEQKLFQANLHQFRI